MSPSDFHADLVWLESQGIGEVSREAGPDQLRHVQADFDPTVSGHGTIDLDQMWVQSLDGRCFITHLLS